MVAVDLGALGSEAVEADNAEGEAAAAQVDDKMVLDSEAEVVDKTALDSLGPETQTLEAAVDERVPDWPASAAANAAPFATRADRNSTT